MYLPVVFWVLLKPHAFPDLCVMAELFSAHLLAKTQHPPLAQMLAHQPSQLSPAFPTSQLSLA